MNKKTARAFNKVRSLAVIPAVLALGCGGAISDQLTVPADAATQTEGSTPDAQAPIRDGSSDYTDADATLTSPTDAPTDAMGIETGEADASHSDGSIADSGISDGTSSLDGSADAADDVSVPISCSETASCASPIYAGNLYGGEGPAAESERGTFGAHSDWYQFQIIQPPPGYPNNSPITIALVFQYPPSTNFEADVYASISGSPVTCTQTTAILTGDAGADLVTKFTLNNSGAPTLAWITIHVIAESGSQCLSGEDWWVEFYSE